MILAHQIFLVVLDAIWLAIFRGAGVVLFACKEHFDYLLQTLITYPISADCLIPAVVRNPIFILSAVLEVVELAALVEMTPPVHAMNNVILLKTINGRN